MTDYEIIDLVGVLIMVAIGLFIYRRFFYKENRWQLKVIILQLVVGLSAGYAFLWLFEDSIRQGVRSFFSFIGV